MRIIFFFVLIAIIGSSSCKKETLKTADTNEIAASPAGTCTGDNWNNAGLFLADIKAPVLVYNNKAYFFSSDDQMIRIWDGTSWSSKPSAVPVLGPILSYYRIFSFYFTIGNKGYLNMAFVFTTSTNQYYNLDFYEYDFITNTWTTKAKFPGNAVEAQASFTIGNKGYVAGGRYDAGLNYSNSSQTWEYNQATNIWTQKASLPNPINPFSSEGRRSSKGFSIGDKGYIVNGKIKYHGAVVCTNTLLQYNPVANQWTTRAAFPGESRVYNTVFVISGAAYVGGGTNCDNSSVEDFYKYNPVTNSWSQIASLDTYSTFGKQAFSINSKGYSVNVTTPGYEYYSIYKYTPKYCPPPGPTP